MNKTRSLAALAALCLALILPRVAAAQIVTTPIVQSSSGQKKEATAVICVDESGVYSGCGGAGGGGGGAGTEYTEDGVATANPIGGTIICVRRDTLSASEVSADGDYVAIKCTSKGEQVVRDADAITALGTLNTSVGTGNSSASTTATNTGTIATNTGTVVTNSTTLAGAVKAEDVASANADPGLVINTKRTDTAAASSGTDGDYQPLITDASGRLHVNVGASALPTGAATAAKQPALGTAGTASTDVITVQGIASGTNLNVACQSGCSGGTQYAEDAVAASGNTGTAALGVQVASPASTAADGDWTWPQYTGGKLHVIDLSANTALGTTADSAWTSGSGSAIALLKAIAAAAVDTTTPVPVKTDQTTPGTTDLVHAAGFAGTATTTVTRPADTTAYAANDNFSDSTSAPTSGGFTLSSVCRASGGSGIISDATIIYSTSSAVAGTIYIYDSAPTAQNDNAAWSVSDSDQLKLVGTIPFATVADGANAVHNVQGLNIGYTCSGSANLRFMVKITTGYTPASADTLTVRAKFVQTN